MAIDPDLMMVIGVTLGALTIPALLSAYSESRPPRLAAIIVLIAAALILVANHIKPGGYTPRDVLHAYPAVFARFTR